MTWDLSLADALIAFFFPFLAMAAVGLALGFMIEFMDWGARRSQDRPNGPRRG